MILAKNKQTDNRVRSDDLATTGSSDRLQPTEKRKCCKSFDRRRSKRLTCGSACVTEPAHWQDEDDKENRPDGSDFMEKLGRHLSSNNMISATVIKSRLKTDVAEQHRCGSENTCSQFTGHRLVGESESRSRKKRATCVRSCDVPSAAAATRTADNNVNHNHLPVTNETDVPNGDSLDGSSKWFLSDITSDINCRSADVRGAFRRSETNRVDDGSNLNSRGAVENQQDGSAIPAVCNESVTTHIDLNDISRISRGSLHEGASSGNLTGKFHSTFSFPLHSTILNLPEPGVLKQQSRTSKQNSRQYHKNHSMNNAQNLRKLSNNSNILFERNLLGKEVVESRGKRNARGSERLSDLVISETEYDFDSCTTKSITRQRAQIELHNACTSELGKSLESLATDHTPCTHSKKQTRKSQRESDNKTIRSRRHKMPKSTCDGCESSQKSFHCCHLSSRKTNLQHNVLACHDGRKLGACPCSLHSYCRSPLLAFNALPQNACVDPSRDLCVPFLYCKSLTMFCPYANSTRCRCCYCPRNLPDDVRYESLQSNHCHRQNADDVDSVRSSCRVASNQRCIRKIRRLRYVVSSERSPLEELTALGEL